MATMLLAGSQLVRVQPFSLPAQARSTRRVPRLAVRASLKDDLKNLTTPDVKEGNTLNEKSIYNPSDIPSKSQHIRKDGDKLDKVYDAMGFSGAGPELINGRLAMLGFITAVGVELYSHKSLIEQAFDANSRFAFFIAVLVFSFASMAPLVQGRSSDDESRPLWNSKNELWNGRAAMVGFLGLIITESVKGSALFG